MSALVLALALTAAPAPSGAKADKIHKLLQVTRADAQGAQLLAALKAKLPPAQYEQISKVIIPAELTERMVAVYERHFTEAQLDGLIAFYESPLGQHLLDEQPAIQRESAEIGQKYALEKLQQLKPSK